MSKPNKDKQKRKTGIAPVKRDYFLTTITIPGQLRNFFIFKAGQCFPGTVRQKGNTGYIGELLWADYKNSVESGEWEPGK